jgi:rod shape-determining protein MreC
MHRIIIFFLRFREYLILSILIITSLILIYQNNNIQLRQIRSISVQVIGFFQERFSGILKAIWIPHLLSISKENQILRESNVILSEEVSRLREATLENIRLRSLLNFKQRSNYNLISAKIVGKTLTSYRNYITLNVGLKDGLNVNMPIITDKGLVGKIVGVSEGYAIGQILRNKDFRASAIDERSRVSGIVGWEGAEYFNMNEVAKNLDIKVGDLIITSEYSSIFSPNIPIGIVSDISYDTGNLFQRIHIKSNVDFSTLEEIFIINSQPDSSRTILENQFLEKE